MGLSGQNSSALSLPRSLTLSKPPPAKRSHLLCSNCLGELLYVRRLPPTQPSSSATDRHPRLLRWRSLPWTEPKENTDSARLCEPGHTHARLGQDIRTRTMSIEMEQAADAILQAAQEASLDELSEVDVDGDGSSSLSEIEYRDIPQDEDAEASDDRSNESEEENDSEAETERLEQSPNLGRTHKDVVLSSAVDGQIYERSPSKLNIQILADDQGDEEEDDALSDDEISVHESHKSSVHGEAAEPTTVGTSLEDSSGEGKRTLSAADADTRKRKRSIMAGSGLDDDIEEPLRKRTGSVMTSGNDYAIEEEEQPEEEGDTSNPISGNISGEEVGENEDEAPDEVEEPAVAEEEVPEVTEIIVTPKKRGRKKKKPVENGVSNHDEEQEALLEGTMVVNGEDETAENEGDEAEAALKNEEERKSCFSLQPLVISLTATQ